MASDLSAPLVVGAGPVGLTMACELARHGVRCRIIDQAHERSQTSKALAIFPRTLEVFDAMGIADKFLAAGHRVRGLVLHRGAQVLATIDLTSVGSSFPFVLTLAQAETERLLSEHLASFGLAVERDVCLTNLAQTNDRVLATLRHADASEEIFDAPWLLGCDGAHSATRHLLGLQFEGAQYEENFLLADVRMAGAPESEHVHLYFGDDGILGVFPFGNDRWRLIASLPSPAAAADTSEPTLLEVEQLVQNRGLPGAHLSDAVWLSRFHVSHRKVRQFRKLRAFLAGDAAHIHSPAGGQGMNTGIQDAVNLAWKVAAVVRGNALAQLLASYEAEREPVARGVLNLTDRMTRMAVVQNSVVRSVRDFLLPAVSGLGLVEEKLAERLCELDIHYRHSSVSENHSGGKVRAGDRAPDAEVREAGGQARRLHELLREPGSMLLIFLGAFNDAEAQLEQIAAHVAALPQDSVRVFRIGRGLPANAGDAHDVTGLAHRAYDLARGGLAWIRPDGYIGYRSDDFDPVRLQNYLARIFQVETTPA